MENSTNINWLVCIYDGCHLNPYRMVVCEILDLASFNKNVRKI